MSTSIFDLDRDSLAIAEKRLNIPRREFLQFCTTVAATLGLPAGAEAAVAKAVEAAKRPSVIWLHFQECTGCTESLLRAEHPTLEKLILDVISLDYHETLMAAAGHQAEAARKAAMAANKGKYILVVEGAIPVAQGGTGSNTAAGARTNLGAQATDAGLTSLMAVDTGPGILPYTDGANSWAGSAITAAGRALLDDAEVVDFVRR